MASVDDVAAYLLTKESPLSTWKLQKLVYYSQAWHLVWFDAPLFDNPIEAWANGPVVRALYNQHKGGFSVDSWGGNPEALGPNEVATLDQVFEGYGGLTGRQLSHLTHSEAPWIDARAGLEPTELSDRQIPLDAIAAYYEALDNDDSAEDVESIDWDF
jgi:uncharacterized phage-associated protein